MLAPALLLAALAVPAVAVPAVAVPAVAVPAVAPPTDVPVEVDGQVDGAFRAGFPITFTLAGPEVLKENGEANPFVDYTFEGQFVEVDENLIYGPATVVPGYFAADGNAGETGADAGDRWRVRYRPDRGGKVGYILELKRGGEVVASGRGIFEVSAPPEADGESRDFRRRGALHGRNGRLVLVPPGGGDAVPFYKTGAGSPENLLAFADFDGTRDLGGKSKPRAGEAEADGLHRYAPHVRDWTDGDPTWRNGKGKGLIGALNYLAGAGANSLYFLTFNVAGDGKDVWPHAAPEGRGPDDRTRFDCSKLDQWDTVFTHCDRLGIALHVLLTETENESLFENRDADLDLFPASPSPSGGAPFADTRKLYYRELIARFGHHPAIIWNLGEENGPEGRGKPNTDGFSNADAQRLAFAQFIKETDPHDHPVVVHTYPGQQEAVYTPLLGSPDFDGASLQLSPMSQTREQTLEWRAKSAAAGNPWFVALDEVGPANAGVLPDDAEDAAENHRDVRRALWANLLSGGSGAEWYFGYQYHDNDLNLEDFRSRAEVWRFSKIAREFAEREGLHEYEPAPELYEAERVVAARRPASETADGALLVYVPAGRDPDAALPAGRHAVRWFDPLSGGAWQSGGAATVQGPGQEVRFGAPPGGDRSRDWVVKIGG